jgi:hypothetical protein
MRRLTLALCSLSLLAGPLRAADDSTKLEPMTVAVEVEPVKTVEPIYRAYVTTSEEKFAFLIPEQFRTGGDPAHGRLQLTSLSGDTLIAFTFIGAVPTDDADGGRERYRNALANRYANGKIVNAFTQPTLGRQSNGFEVEWKGPAGLAQKTCAVYVPTASGMLEVTMSTGAKNFKVMETRFKEMLASLASDEHGKLKVHHIAATG